MYSDRDDAALPAPGCPIRESTGQRLLNASPWLIAVVHALHRLLMPRHPPCALTILTVILNSEDLSPRSSVIYPDVQGHIAPDVCLANCAVFKVRQEGAPRAGWLFRSSPQEGIDAEKPAHGRSLKTQQHVCARGAFRPSPVDMLEALAGHEADGRAPVLGAP
jgi:hypothetical protein